MTVIAALLIGTAGLPQDRTLTVFAAASLRESFTEIGRRYEVAHPGTHIRLSFGGSQQLAAQIRSGAEVDVFAAAAETQLRAAGTFASPIRTFATNTLTIVVPTDEKRVEGLADIAKVDRLVVADPSVPAGAYTVDILNRARLRFGAPWRALVDRRIASRETDVRSVLAKVVLGEADAGIVYVSDAKSAAGKVRAIAIPSDLNALATYPVAVPASTRQAGAAKEFIQFLFSSDAQKILEGEGFVSPLRPVRELKVIGGSKTKALMVGHLDGAKVTAQAKDETGTVRAYKGTSVASVLEGMPGSQVRFEGADGTRVEVPLGAIRRLGGVLMDMGDGNLQAVLPGQSPSKWVRWLRRIVVH